MNHRKAMFRFLFPSLFLGLFLLQGCASLEPTVRKQTDQLSTASVAVVNSACIQDNRAVQDYFGLIDKIKKEQPELVRILTKFPKGADLHNHLSGTVMPEDYIALGSTDGDCFGVDPVVPAMYTITQATTPGVCASGFKPLMQASAEERQQLNNENVSYVETMISFQSAAVSSLADLLRQKYPDAAAYTQSSNYPAMFDYLLGAGLKNAVFAAQEDVDNYVNAVNAILKCGTAAPDTACEVSFYFQAAVNRNAALKDGSADLPKKFTQTALSCLLADTEKSVVGVNLLSGEDSPVSMQSFNTQMQFFSYFHNRFPRMNIALHGGEITPCFVGTGNPALKEHITGSIQAGAKRVGHAVSFTYLNDADKAEVTTLMKRNNTLVEIPFTSNAQILGIAGEEHPFVQYFRKYGVPAAFSTDD